LGVANYQQIAENLSLNANVILVLISIFGLANGAPIKHGIHFFASLFTKPLSKFLRHRYDEIDEYDNAVVNLDEQFLTRAKKIRTDGITAVVGLFTLILVLCSMLTMDRFEIFAIPDLSEYVETPQWTHKVHNDTINITNIPVVGEVFHGETNVRWNFAMSKKEVASIVYYIRMVLLEIYNCYNVIKPILPKPAIVVTDWLPLYLITQILLNFVIFVTPSQMINKINEKLPGLQVYYTEDMNNGKDLSAMVLFRDVVSWSIDRLGDCGLFTQNDQDRAEVAKQNRNLWLRVCASIPSARAAKQLLESNPALSQKAERLPRMFSYDAMTPDGHRMPDIPMLLILKRLRQLDEHELKNHLLFPAPERFYLGMFRRAMTSLQTMPRQLSQAPLQQRLLGTGTAGEP